MLSILLSVAGVLFLGWLGLAAWMFVFQARLVYFPTRDLVALPSDAGLAFEDLTLTEADGVRIHAWSVPASDNPGTGRATGPDAGAKSTHDPGRWVVFCHGNAGNSSHRLQTLRIFHDLGLSTLIFDYRGYGRSEGKPDEQGTYKDAAAAFDHLVAQGVPPERIIAWGRSLGGAVAAWLAENRTPGALILESTFTSLPDLGAGLYPYMPVRLLARYKYDTRSRLGKIHCPVLVIHSPEDEIVPFAYGRALFEAAREPKRFLEIRGGHDDGFVESGEGYLGGVRSFLSGKVLSPGL